MAAGTYSFARVLKVSADLLPSLWLDRQDASLTGHRRAVPLKEVIADIPTTDKADAAKTADSLATFVTDNDLVRVLHVYLFRWPHLLQTHTDEQDGVDGTRDR